MGRQPPPCVHSADATYDNTVMLHDTTFDENAAPPVYGGLVSPDALWSCCTRWPVDRDGPEPVLVLSRLVGSRYRVYTTMYHITPLVKNPRFGAAICRVCTYFIADPHIARICVHTIVAGFICRSVKIALAIWMYLLCFKYCQYMAFGYCSQHTCSHGSFRAQTQNMKKANK